MLFCLGSLVKFSLICSLLIFVLWLCLIDLLYRNDLCYQIRLDGKSIDERKSLWKRISIDERIELNHLSIIGTHNSYHRENLFYRYEHFQLDEQFGKGIRQIELDIHLMKDFQLIYHLQLFDSRTNCYCLIQCFQLIDRWTNRQRRKIFFPIFIFIEIKQMFYEDLYTGLSLSTIQCEHFQQIQNEFLQIFSFDDFIRSKDVRGNFSSIRLALKQQFNDQSHHDYSSKNYGWPSLKSSIGKLLLVFLDDVHQISTKLYSKCFLLQDFFFIGQSHSDRPYSSIITINPKTYSEESLRSIYSNGQMTRFILQYGIPSPQHIYSSIPPYSFHILSTDSFPSSSSSSSPSPFESMLNDHYRSQSIHCHSMTSPSFCSSTNFSLF